MLDKIPTKTVPETDSKCDLCTSSLCCTYFTQEIATPRSKYDYEHLLWQISHNNVHIYKDDEGWYLLIMTSCQHLVNPGGRCGIYDVRPQICRDHKNDYCEYDQPAEEGWELYFEDYHSLRQYCKKRFKKWER